MCRPRRSNKRRYEMPKADRVNAKPALFRSRLGPPLSFVRILHRSRTGVPFLPDVQKTHQGPLTRSLFSSSDVSCAARSNPLEGCAALACSFGMSFEMVRSGWRWIARGVSCILTSGRWTFAELPIVRVPNDSYNKTKRPVNERT